MSANPVVVDSGIRKPSGRWARYAQVTLANISVRRAQTPEEFEMVAQLREQGFGRLVEGNGSHEWVDASDHAPGVFSLLAYTSTDEAIATMRVEDSSVSTLELASRVPLNALLTVGQWPAAQFSRLSVIKHPEGQEAMFALFKAAWRWSFFNDLRSIVIATPPWARLIYDFMCFDELGPSGRFTHELAGGAEHVSMRLDVQDAEVIWRSHGQPLCTVFVDVFHPRICADLRSTVEEIA